MDKSNAVAFGTVNLKANTLETPSRPGGSSGQKAQAALGNTPMVVGESRPGGTLGQKTVPSGGGELYIGQTRPGGSKGQGSGASGPKPKPYTMID